MSDFLLKGRDTGQEENEAHLKCVIDQVTLSDLCNG